ncbi:hypothetical protein MAR_007542 [Mya arenaria]|uniref:Uncharacterized protein n=1 Tax=Mya arenaria TaxID=6604 RepID=A0ABY7DBL1_MYAAR|nr:hypothetical protein MAR_007542 [Mya arenaria]
MDTCITLSYLITGEIPDTCDLIIHLFLWNSQIVYKISQEFAEISNLTSLSSQRPSDVDILDEYSCRKNVYIGDLRIPIANFTTQNYFADTTVILFRGCVTT